MYTQYVKYNIKKIKRLIINCFFTYFTEIFGILVLLSFDITAFTLIAYQRCYLQRT